MSLSAALNTAVIGLQTLQQQTRIVSGNVANAQNPNYSRKVSTLTSPVAEGLPQAALISQITRVASREIQQDLYRITADYGQLDRQLTYTKELAETLDATNTTGEQPTLLAMMTRFEDAWKALEATPEDTATRSLVVQRGVELTAEIRRLNGQQSELQTRAQEQISTDIQIVNDAALQIAKLNVQITSQLAGNNPIGDLEDLRDQEVAKLADKIGIRTVVNDRGELFVYSDGGVQIVGTVAQQFEYQAAGVPPGIFLQGGTDNLNLGFLSGSIRASLDYLDSTATGLASTDPNVGTLAKYFNQLDSFAANLHDVINNAYGANFFDYSAALAAPPDEAGKLIVAAALVATPTNVDPTVAGAVQQAMRNTTLTAAQVNRSATDPNGLTITSVNIFGLANGILAYHARATSDNEANRDTAERQQHTLDQKLRNLTGVNIDDELAQLQVLQNNYAALANVMNTVTAMFDELVNIGR
ncbi:MAG: flagellar hook-associated protein FlgK [Ferrovibrio sp.]|jgi:flagellar hook-associated protein 1 FlgK